MSASPPLVIEQISQALRTTHIGRRIHLFPEIGSTNAEAQALAQAGAPHGTMVLAECQTAGRGRLGRTWFSPPGKNLYASVIVRTDGLVIPLQTWLPWVPLSSALAVAQAVQAVTGLSLQLKWPNDLLRDDRKIGGILCESTIASATDATVIIGIGLNVNVLPDEFPQDLRPIASSLRMHSTEVIDRNRLLPQLCLAMESGLDAINRPDLSRVHEAYQAACGTVGRQVRILWGNGDELLGHAESIGQDGALLVRPLPTQAIPAPQIVAVRTADVLHVR